MVRAVACADVPKLTVIVGGSFGAGNYGRQFFFHHQFSQAYNELDFKQEWLAEQYVCYFAC